MVSPSPSVESLDIMLLIILSNSDNFCSGSVPFTPLLAISDFNDAVFFLVLPLTNINTKKVINKQVLK